MQRTIATLTVTPVATLVSLFIFAATGSPLYAQRTLTDEAPKAWRSLDQVPANRQAEEPWVRPLRGKTFSLDTAEMKNALSTIPMELSPLAAEQPKAISLPMPDGTFAKFTIVESPVMAPELAAKFPQIKTYAGQGIDDPHATVRLDMTPRGFHAQILSPNGAVYIDPYSKGKTDLYSSYYKRDYKAKAKSFSCQLHDVGAPVAGLRASASSLLVGETLRTYRLAVAATAEYTAFHGGTVLAGQSAIVTAVNRVSGVYEAEVSVRLELVANNDQLVFTSSPEFPVNYSNGSGGAMLGQNQSNIDSIIGSANYDIGHVFSTGGGGVAGLGVVCFNGSKARGVTGQGSPIGDPFYIDYVAHEMGHQFGGTHTFNGVNGSCSGGNRTSFTAYEPGSGTTIMAYAGICGNLDDLQSNSDPYFHSASFTQIRNQTAGGFADTCDVPTATGNNAPTVDAGSDFLIPSGTPFTLTASGSDPDLDPVTYQWEERDLGPAQPAAGFGSEDNGDSPLFRSFNPTTEPTRTFPKWSDILNNVQTIGEQLPSTSRVNNFRVTIRDNRAGGGGVAFDDMFVTSTTAAGPFRISAPNTSVVWGGSRTVLWDVAGTNAAPINTANVTILLSMDSGLTFPTILAANTPNDGSEVVVLPNLVTSTARIKIEAEGNIYFDVSDFDFVIDPDITDAPISPAFPDNQRKNRYISFVPNNVGSVAFRVELTSGPGTAGLLGWVGAAFDPGCQNEDGSAKPGLCIGEAMARIVSTPVFREWPEPIIHIADCGIVPTASYEMRTTSNGTLFSDPYAVSTITQPLDGRFWADVVGGFDNGSQTWFPPDGGVNGFDVTAVLRKFQKLASAPHLSWVDLNPQVPDFVANGNDVLQAVNAFGLTPYPFVSPDGCP